MGTRAATRELAVAATAVILVARLLDGPAAWAVGVLLVVGVALGSLQVLGEGGSRTVATGVPVESLVVTALTAFAVLGVSRLVPMSILLVPALIAGAWLMARVLGTEARILASTSGASAADRTAVLIEVLIVAFLAFTGVAALVPGGLPEPGTAVLPPPTGPELATLAGADALLAFLLAYRSAALRSSNVRDVAWFALTSAVVVGIGAVGLRAMEIPRLLGPALLVLVLFLWDALHGTPPTRRRDPRRIWESILLVVLGIVVVAWSLRLRG